jgi:hypothetical protein
MLQQSELMTISRQLCGGPRVLGNGEPVIFYKQIRYLLVTVFVGGDARRLN